MRPIPTAQLKTSANVVAALLAMSTVACDTAIELKNARPRVTWVSIEAVPEGDATCPFRTCARLTLWVADVEGDAVDVTSRWVAGAESGELALVPGSYPLTGLPTRSAEDRTNGEPHMVLWDLADVPAGTVTLALTTDDRPYDGSKGDTYTTPAIDPRTDVSPVEAARQ